MKKMLETFINLFKRDADELPDRKDNKTIGAHGEQIAVRFLKKNGYKILQRNYRSKSGEIDVICYDHGVIVFAEVKTRYSDRYGPPELAVTDAKKRQIARVAGSYVSGKKLEGRDFRFDVVSVFFSPLQKHPAITLFKNAFTISNATASGTTLQT